jgi:Icc protein
MPVKLAVVGDIHHGRDFGTKKGTAALGLLGQFVEHVNKAELDAVIDLGDRISDDPAQPQPPTRRRCWPL